MAPNAAPPTVRLGGGSAPGKKGGFKPDLSKPLVFQVGHLGEDYDDWVHQPIISKTGPRLFASDFMEMFTNTHWWMIPMFWMPVVIAAEWKGYSVGTPTVLFPPLFLLGLGIWTFLEYCIHRFLFHWRTTTYVTNTLHYLLHGCHHKHPQDRFRLVMPPLLFAILSTTVAFPLYLIFPSFLFFPAYGGGIMGYICYDMTHYFVHFGIPIEFETVYFLRRYHMAHHFKEYNMGFGITNSFWDHVFGTYPTERAKAAEAK
eukprot:TRINITY_DN2059_c0_g1_i4.p1 TRINITY_DN2059_c0_g1~~TRINITY_DN2059_c0_g1_i4.p1  ORF type:complete len:296 (+),score=6.57 TRINITY_DN2059_c0_g1_i4:117-890(+)